MQFNVAIINNFVVLKTLSFPTQVWTCVRFSIFLNFDICLFKILSNKHNADLNLAQRAYANMYFSLVSHTRDLMFLEKL